MAQFIVDAVDGTYTRDLKTGKFHDIIVKGQDGTMTAGTLTIECQPFGAADDIYNPIPNNTIDLSAPVQLQFTGSVQSYKFTVANFAGTATKLIITDFVGLV